MVSIAISPDQCVGCRLCLNQCPFGAIEIINRKAEILENCTLCGSCVSACKFQAIVLSNDPSNIAVSGIHQGVWVYAEQQDGRVNSVAYELIAEAAKLAASLQSKVAAIILGSNVKKIAANLIAYGADEVYAVDRPELNYLNEEIYSDIIVQLVQKYQPEVMLFGATAFGRSLAPRVASRLNTGLTADCTSLEIEPETRLLLQTRPAFGGNLMATIACPHHRPQMATVRPKVMKALPPVSSRQGPVHYPEIIFPSNPQTRIVELLLSGTEQLNLAEADIVVAAGRGLGKAKNMALIEDLAEILGAGVGASRSIVDLGWIEYSRQIGQTGKTVAPQIYIACGISGAIQHLAGMSSASFIIAINKDPDAPIFKVANIGLVGDCLDIIPHLTTELKKRKAELRD